MPAFAASNWMNWRFHSNATAHFSMMGLFKLSFVSAHDICLMMILWVLIIHGVCVTSAQNYESHPALGVTASSGSRYALSCASIDTVNRTAVLRVSPVNGVNFDHDGAVELHEGGIITSGKLQRGGIIATQTYQNGGSIPLDFPVNLNFADDSRSYFAVRQTPGTTALSPDLWSGPVVISENSEVAFPSVTTPIARQIPGTKKVEILYDLSDSDHATVIVDLEISSDGGTTYNVPAVSLTCDVGPAVQPGPGKRIVWNAGADWPEMYSDQMKFRINATSYVLTLSQTGYTVSRSGSIGDQVSWVFVEDGTVVLTRNASNELSYTYFRNYSGKTFVVYLQTKTADKTRVSNSVTYSVP